MAFSVTASRRQALQRLQRGVRELTRRGGHSHLAHGVIQSVPQPLVVLDPESNLLHLIPGGSWRVVPAILAEQAKYRMEVQSEVEKDVELAGVAVWSSPRSCWRRGFSGKSLGGLGGMADRRRRMAASAPTTSIGLIRSDLDWVALGCARSFRSLAIKAARSCCPERRAGATGRYRCADGL